MCSGKIRDSIWRDVIMYSNESVNIDSTRIHMISKGVERQQGGSCQAWEH